MFLCLKRANDGCWFRFYNAFLSKEVLNGERELKCSCFTSHYWHIPGRCSFTEEGIIEFGAVQVIIIEKLETSECIWHNHALIPIILSRCVINITFCIFYFVIDNFVMRSVILSHSTFSKQWIISRDRKFAKSL